MAFDQLHGDLLALASSGAAGFEGFVRDALAEVTGQGFRVMKAGPQGGVDCIGEPTGTGLVIGMEGKRYAATTRLGLDELKSKLRDAAGQFPAMDLWLLATTRPIDGGDAKALGAIGDGLGVDVLVLDWSDGGALPPPLAVLCAAAPAAAAHHLSKAAVAELAAVEAHPLFPGERMRLVARLRDPAVGLAAARDAAREWTIRQMRDPASARVAFDSYATLEAPGAVRIERPAVSALLDQWRQAGPAGPAVLLGQEGMGKTWAALSWWLAASAADRSATPLTLVIPARDVTSIDGPALIATALLKATGVRDFGFWKRRLDRWLDADAPGPMLLVVIDGLNQNWLFRQWSDLLLSFDAGDRRGRIAALMTCRPGHWHGQLKALGDSRLAITAIDVSPFTDGELDHLLARHGVNRQSLQPKLIELMRTPRLSGIAIDRRAELQLGGEITPERLIYEDWRYRHHRAQQSMSHAEFRAFIGRLGRELQRRVAGAIERHELLQRLSDDGVENRESLEIILSELMEGGWLTLDGTSGKYLLDKDRTPAALGLALLDDVRRGTTPEERAEILGQQLDPLQGSDLASVILRNAVTFAIVDPAVTADLKHELLREWLGSQNFSPADFQSYWRLIAYDPGLFVDLAEEDWFDDGPSARSDEVLVKGFANAFKYPQVATALEAELVEWFSRYWLDPLKGEVFGDLADDAPARERRRGTSDRAATALAEGVAEAFGLTLLETTPARQAWGSYRATELLSWLPRAPLVAVFTAWALTRAVLGGQRQFDAVAWVLRWNEHDPIEAEAAILARAEALIDQGGQIARHAAGSLLDALATPAARALHAARLPQPAPRRASDDIAWPIEQASQRRPLDAALSLTADPANPAIELPLPFLERLRQLAQAVDDQALLASQPDLMRTLSHGLVALARWAPGDLGDLIRRRSTAALATARIPDLPSWAIKGWKAIAARIGRGEPTIKAPNPEWLASSLLVLSDDELARWSDLSERLRASGVEPATSLEIAALAGRPAEAQVETLRSIAPDEIPDWTKRLLATPSGELIEKIGRYLKPSEPSERLRMWIAYLQESARGAIPPGWEPLVRLIEHPDETVRASVFEFIYVSDNAEAADRLAAAGWSWREGMNRSEAVYGSLALTLSAEARRGEIAERVHPEVLGGLAEDHPDQSIYLERFAEYVRAEIELYFTARSRSFPRAVLNQTRGWDALKAAYSQELIEWTRPVVEGTARNIHWVMVEPFPLLQALDAVEGLTPGAKARVIQRALEENQGSSFRSGDLYRQATRLPGTVGEASRQLALAEANDDSKLFDFALGVQETGQGDWLVAQIEADLTGPAAGIIARGLTLAGFLQPSDEHDALWSNRLAEPPASGWLADVHRAAHARYVRAKQAAHWSRLFRGSDDRDIAFGAFELFVETLDGRVYSGDCKPSQEELHDWDWRRQLHWTLGWGRVKSAAKAQSSALAKLFLATKQPLSNQSPRRR